MPLDIAIGILLGMLIPQAFGLDASWVFLVFGVGFALLPDLDAVIEYARRGAVSGKTQTIHREWFHYPLSYIPVALAIGFAAGTVWGVLFASAIFLHFVHDSVGIGWGIKWLMPFSGISFKFFSKNPQTGKFRTLQRWQPQELTQVVADHGDPNWLQNHYFRPSKTLFIEAGALLLAILLVVVLI